jgi:tripartite-type tricarboxylate transporter receptor subunit TctC
MTLLLRAAAALLLMAASAFARSHPGKQVRIVVPFPAGGSADILCRPVGEKLSAALGAGTRKRAGAPSSSRPM